MKLLFTQKYKAFTLAEVVISAGLAALVLGGTMYGYVMSARRAEWSAYSLAAHSLAMQRMEQTRAAKWDPLGFPPVDNLVAANFPLVTTNIMDIPVIGTNYVYATNRTTITTISAAPPLKMVRIDCTWAFPKRGSFTNTIVCYRAPDQ